MGQVTRERRRKPFQLARGAMAGAPHTDAGFKTNRPPWFRQCHLPNRIIFSQADLSGLDLLFLLCSKPGMSDRPASWRIPNPKQMEKLAAEAARRPAAPDARLPAEYWESVLNDPRAGANGAQMRRRPL